MATEFHPDINPDPAAAENFKRIKAAYDTLNDPDKRAAYDAELSGVRSAVRPQTPLLAAAGILLRRRVIWIPAVLVTGFFGLTIFAREPSSPPSTIPVARSTFAQTAPPPSLPPSTPYFGLPDPTPLVLPTPKLLSGPQPIPANLALPPLLAELRARAAAEYPRARALAAGAGEPKLVNWDIFYFERGTVAPELGGRAGISWTFDVLGGRQGYQVVVGYAPTGAQLWPASAGLAVEGAVDLWSDQRVYQLMALMQRERPVSTINAYPATRIDPNGYLLDRLFKPSPSEADFVITSFFFSPVPSASGVPTVHDDPFYWAKGVAFSRYRLPP